MRKGDYNSICYVGIGSNKGDPVTHCLDSIKHISSLEDVEVLRRSSLYRTEPVGFKEQEWFINCVVEVRTPQTPHTLLRMLQLIEDRMGRIRGEKWGPRIIDLDILLYGQKVIEDDNLHIPHPELHRRRFVLVPLNEIASYVIHPLFGVSIQGLLNRLEGNGRVEQISEDVAVG